MRGRAWYGWPTAAVGQDLEVGGGRLRHRHTAGREYGTEGREGEEGGREGLWREVVGAEAEGRGRWRRREGVAGQRLRCRSAGSAGEREALRGAERH